MKRRGTTLLVGAILLAVLSLLFARVPVPYVELEPGPTVNTLGTSDGHDVIKITGVPTSTSAGQLRLVTVQVAPEISIGEAIRGWFQHDYAVVPRELIYPPDQTEQQVDQQNAEDFKQSQNSAETAALRALHYPVQVTVTQLVANAAAQGHLEPGDVITSVDGEQVTSAQKLADLVRAKPVGSALAIGYTRDGAPATTTITTGAGENGKPALGVQVEQKQPHPFEISFDLDKIGGPSAGLMFALGIIDKIDPTDLTGGIVVAGTGTIDDDGVVGPIGGVPQKMIGAREAGATVFLTPADNCAEAVANAVPGLRLVKVSSLDDALNALKALREHREPAPCTGK
ncbi:MAG TPA: PDZ domain-containing protein [Micromonosporaceae bacterium]